MADSGTYDQATILRRQKLAEQMLAQDSQPPVVKNWAQGLSHLANVGVDSFNLNRLDKQAADARKADTAALMAGLGLGDQPAATSPMPSASPTPSTPSPMPAPSPQVIGAGGKPETPDAQGAYSADAVMMPPSGGQDFGKAIAGIESGGKYDALGPVTKTGDRAYGKYQVMGNNIPEWTKTHLGQSMTPEQFLANPQAQDAVFKGQFGQYADKYGPEGAARAWFAGPGGMNNPNATDQLGTSVADYGKKFAANLGPQAAIAQAMTPGGATAFSGEPQPSAAAPPGGPPAPSGTPASPVAQAMTGGAPAPGGAPGGPPQGGTPIPGAPGGIAPSQKEAIARLLSATPGSAAQQLGLQLAGQVIKPNNFTFQTLPDGTVLRMDPTGRTAPTPVYQAPVKPQFTQIGEDMLGNKRFGFVDATGRKVTDIGGQPIGGPGGAGAGAGNIPTGPDGQPLQGQELLKNLEKTDPLAASGVKGIIAGDLNMGGRNLQKLGPLAELVDPTMKQFDYQSRAKTRTDYTSGSSAKEITAINTAIGHADQLAGISPKLGGFDVAPGILNPLSQSFKRNTGDTGFQDAKRDWDTKSETLATEVSKALNGGVPHVADKEHWRGILSAASSPTERSSALKSIMGVLESRLHAKAQAYQQGMGTTREPFSFLNPENEGKYQRLLATGAAEPQAPAGAPAAAATSPDRAAIEAEMKKRGLL